MGAKDYVVKTKRKILCDCCKVVLRGRTKASRTVQFELFYRDEEGNTIGSYRFKDLCQGCRRVLRRLPSRVENIESCRKKDPKKKKVQKRKKRARVANVEKKPPKRPPPPPPRRSKVRRVRKAASG